MCTEKEMLIALLEKGGFRIFEESTMLEIFDYDSYEGIAIYFDKFGNIIKF